MQRSAAIEDTDVPAVVSSGESHSDAALMARYRDGDAGAFDMLYSRHRARVYRYLLSQCRERALADELHQEVWLSVIRSRASYKPLAAFTTWVFALARSRLIDHHRRERGFLRVETGDEPGDIVEQLIDGRASPAEEHLHRKRCVERLLRAVEGLPPAQREAFVLQEEGMTLAQIGEATQTAPETVKSRIRYALAKLRDNLADCL